MSIACLIRLSRRQKKNHSHFSNASKVTRKPVRKQQTRDGAHSLLLPRRMRLLRTDEIAQRVKLKSGAILYYFKNYFMLCTSYEKSVQIIMTTLPRAARSD